MDFFRKKIGPVFIKESSDNEEYIRKLEALREKADESVREKIDKQIKYAKYGEIGENNIAFELKNSGMDMLILHDLHLEADGLQAQIDYLVITRKINFVIECKNLYGNIKIDNRGAFIRRLSGGREQGMYSPVTQNERHLKVIKALRLKEKGILGKSLFEKNFDNVYKSIIVLANPQTVLYDKYAPKAIKEKVIRYDQLVDYIKKINDASDMLASSEKEMKELASFFMDKIVPVQSDYSKKYQEMIENTETGSPETEHAEEETVPNTERDILVQKLKEYRLQQSRQEHIKPYYIFNDATLEDLLQKMPGTKEELLTVSGFGPAKAEKYGKEILNILGKVK